MASTERIRCVVAGSFFKFKPEIDRAIDELAGHGVIVLAPEKGWLYVPPQRILFPDERQFRPLPSERGMNVRQIEDEFLRSLSQSDFVYVVNPGGYVGNTVSMEIGVAIALGIPVYAQEPLSIDLDKDPVWAERVSQIQSLAIGEIVDLLSKVCDK